MPTIVVHHATGQRFVLVGTGFAATETARPGLFTPEIETKTSGMLALCGADGVIHWRSSRDYAVGEVDGHSPAQLLGALSPP